MEKKQSGSLGKLAEDFVAQRLAEQGCKILGRNYRTRLGEIGWMDPFCGGESPQSGKHGFPAGGSNTEQAEKASARRRPVSGRKSGSMAAQI